MKALGYILTGTIALAAIGGIVYAATKKPATTAPPADFETLPADADAFARSLEKQAETIRAQAAGTKYAEFMSQVAGLGRLNMPEKTSLFDDYSGVSGLY